MTLSIAVGGRSSSSQPLPECLGKKSAFKRLVAVGVNHDSSLGATATILYRNPARKENTEKNSLNDNANVDYTGEDEKHFTGEAPLQGNEKAEFYVELVLEINSLCQESSSNPSKADRASPSKTRFRIPIIEKHRIQSDDDKEPAIITNSPARINIDPLVTFSSDGRHVTCLIPPLPESKCSFSNDITSSTIVILNLRFLNTPQKNKNLPLPSFIHQRPSTSTSYQQPNLKIPIPMDPRIVRISLNLNDNHFIVTTICEACAPSKTSILLAGCHDGSILAINYKRARLAGVLFHPRNDGNHDSSSIDEPKPSKYCHIKSMSHYSPPQSRATNILLRQDTSSQDIGRLCTVRADGSVVVYTSSFSSSIPKIRFPTNDESSTLNDAIGHSNTSLPLNRQFFTQSSSSSLGSTTDFNVVQSYNLEKAKSKNLVIKIQFLCYMKPKKHIPSYFRHSQWINFSTLALVAGGQSDGISAQVWVIQTNGDIYKLSELEMDENILLQEKHGSFEPQSQNTYTGDLAHHSKSKSSNISSIHFDPVSGCLAISGRTNTNDKYSYISYVCIWDWRSKVLGLTLTSSNTSICTFSKLVFGYRGMSLFHYHIHEQKAEPKTKGNKNKTVKRLYRDMFKTGILSPPSAIKGSNIISPSGGWIENATPLFLSSDFVALPIVSKSTLTLDTTLEWKQYLIPSSYLDEYGPVSIAAVGEKKGQFIGLASSRGVCILDLQKLKNKEYVDTVLQQGSASSPCVQSSISANSAVKHVEEKQMLKNSDHKFRLVWNPDEERSFKVHAMVWWERDDKKGKSDSLKNMIKADDLLIAIIEYSSEEKDKQLSGEFYLVCWSPKRLGLGENQLLEDSGFTNKNMDDSHTVLRRNGIRIPNNLSPDSISILPEPNHNSIHDRAIVLISSTPAYSCEESAYVLFQLQTNSNTEGTTNYKSRPYNKANYDRVRGKLVSHGFFPCSSDLSSMLRCSCSGAFLAGGSFRFSLYEKEQSPIDRHMNEYIATVGVIKSDGGGLDSVIIGTSGTSYSGFVLFNNCRAQMICDDTKRNFSSIQGIVKYWKSDTVRLKRPFSTSESRDRYLFYEYFAWTIALNDGNIFTWNVPCFIFQDGLSPLDADINILEGLADEELCYGYSLESNDQVLQNRLRNQLKLLPNKKSMLQFSTSVEPQYIYKSGKPILCVSKHKARSPLLGFASCLLGDASLWMNGIAGTGMNEISIGPLPFSSNGCILYCGQRCKRLSQHISSKGGYTGVNLVIELFGLTDCKLSTPSFMPSMLSSILDFASELNEPTSRNGIAMFPDPILIRKYIESLLLDKNHETVLSTLKVLILRCSEFLADVTKSSRSQPLRDKDLNLAIAFAASTLRLIITIARKSLSALEFASLFLGIGRQIEPYLFDALFPLTLEPSSDQNKEINVLSVHDLFQLSLKSGSVWIAVSALPIFSSQSDAHLYCLQLLKSCLDAVGHSKVFGNSGFRLHSVEETYVLQQLYQFGSKLEDAEESLHVHRSHDDGDIEQGSSYSTSTDESIEDFSSEESEEGSFNVDSSAYDSYDEISQQGESSDCASWESSSINDYINGSILSSSGSESNSSKKDESFVKISVSSSGKASQSTETGFARITSLLLPRSWNKTNEDFSIEETAIQNAASSFITSGFDELQYGDEIPKKVEKIALNPNIDKSIQDGTSTGIAGNIQTNLNEAFIERKELNDLTQFTEAAHLTNLNDEFKKYEENHSVSQRTSVRTETSFVKENGNISDAVCRYLVSVSFSVNKSHRFDPSGWKSAALISDILCKDLCHESFIKSNQLELERTLLQLLEDTDSASKIFGLKESNHGHKYDQADDDALAEDLTVGKWFFAGRIMECMEQVDQKNADQLFRLTLYLIQIKGTSKENRQMKTSLAVLALISGHVSGSLQEFFGTSWENSPIGRFYSLAVAEVLQAL